MPLCGYSLWPLSSLGRCFFSLTGTPPPPGSPVVGSGYGLHCKALIFFWNFCGIIWNLLEFLEFLETAFRWRGTSPPPHGGSLGGVAWAAAPGPTRRRSGVWCGSGTWRCPTARSCCPSGRSPPSLRRRSTPTSCWRSPGRRLFGWREPPPCCLHPCVYPLIIQVSFVSFCFGSGDGSGEGVYQKFNHIPGFFGCSAISPTHIHRERKSRLPQRFFKDW